MLTQNTHSLLYYYELLARDRMDGCGSDLSLFKLNFGKLVNLHMNFINFFLYSYQVLSYFYNLEINHLLLLLFPF